ncbi:helix-turn-helix transcriptional regulator [Muricauda sp. CAU 1633]|uniref:helix-turn-helix domain-containing protein n=1 Tax=Allomuricauda sp. CAU 1633 TaxID=2816036 RepID=UPI001A8D34DD|nr:AraC family transcriptional regulator [Muricauda sp. CAU 1633]MBO0321430.1 helix-turn-helix transcriptional regulator [Muricauda sp. CAU 1633]
MITIQINAKNTAETFEQIKNIIGGEVMEKWGQQILAVDNENAKGEIRALNFDWGACLLEYDITFFDEVTLITDSTHYNPISFVYCLEGYCGHKFGYQEMSDLKILKQYQSVIISSRANGFNHGYLPAGIPLHINVIRVHRNQFMSNRLNKGEALNEQLYKVFLDTDHKNVFSYYGSYNLKMADLVSSIKNVTADGMIRILQLEGLVYQILSMHILQHNNEVLNNGPKTSLLNRELNTIRDCAKQIENNIAKDFSLEEIAAETGLTQAKLQEGFKLLYNKTVTEYIRNARLEVARDLINTTEMNISEVVYSIGFTSRSYFSKIFKEKYGISPSEFKSSKREMGLSA